MTGRPSIRRPDLVRVDAFREWIRTYAPPGTVYEADGSRWGFCADDVDLIFRVWHRGDHVGRLNLAEVKWQGFSLAPSQRIALERLDQVMQLGAAALAPDDPARIWGGVHRIEYDDLKPTPACPTCQGTGYNDAKLPRPERDQIRWWVDGRDLTADEFVAFLAPHPGRGVTP